MNIIRGDAVMLGRGFGVIQLLNPQRGIALIEFQSRTVFEVPLDVVIQGILEDNQTGCTEWHE